MFRHDCRWIWVPRAAVKTVSLFPLRYALESELSHSTSLFLNCLWAPCPLMEASSHGKEGNQINCMSVNRITSSLTYRESGLKLITHAWKKKKNGEKQGGVEEEKDKTEHGVFPGSRDSLLHRVAALNMPTVCAYAYSTIYAEAQACMHTHTLLTRLCLKHTWLVSRSRSLGLYLQIIVVRVWNRQKIETQI